MPWVVTLKITDCGTSQKLVGAWITDGSVTYTTDANGEFLAIINDAFHTYIVNIGQTDYISKNFAIVRASMEGTTQNVCLNREPPDTGGGGGGGGDGW